MAEGFQAAQLLVGAREGRVLLGAAGDGDVCGVAGQGDVCGAQVLGDLAEDVANAGVVGVDDSGRGRAQSRGDVRVEVVQALQQVRVEPLFPAGQLGGAAAAAEAFGGADQQDDGQHALGQGGGDVPGVEVARGAVGQGVLGVGGVAVGQGPQVVAVAQDQAGGGVGGQALHGAGLSLLVPQEPQAVSGRGRVRGRVEPPGEARVRLGEPGGGAAEERDQLRQDARLPGTGRAVHGEHGHINGGHAAPPSPGGGARGRG
ncbi:hypothetical protein ACFQ2B_40730 [Streptomyces stramineus]